MLNLLEKPVIVRKTCRKTLEILQTSAIISKRVQRYQDLKTDIQHRSNEDLTQKLNLVKEVLDTKESSDIMSKRSTVASTNILQVEIIFHLLCPLYQYEGLSLNGYSSTTWCSNYPSNLIAYIIIIRYNH